MSKGLEALEELKFQVGNITYHTRDLQITSLKVRDSGLFETIEKELKVLEIVKKSVAELVVLDDLTHAVYDNEFYQSIHLTQEEYDLLKEVLL